MISIDAISERYVASRASRVKDRSSRTGPVREDQRRASPGFRSSATGPRFSSHCAALRYRSMADLWGRCNSSRDAFYCKEMDGSARARLNSKV